MAADAIVNARERYAGWVLRRSWTAILLDVLAAVGALGAPAVAVVNADPPPDEPLPVIQADAPVAHTAGRGR